MATEAGNVEVAPAPSTENTQAQNEAMRQTALGAPPRTTRVAFEPKPVTFLPLDIIKYVDELSSSERFASNKTSPALDVVLLGTTANPLYLLKISLEPYLTLLI